MSSRPQTALQWSLRAGAVYFCVVAGAHMLGVKVPVLYLYPTLPSYACALPACDVRAIWLGFAGCAGYLAWLTGWYWRGKVRR